MARRAAGASTANVAQAVRDALGRGNAVDAVATGVLAAAASTPSVLLGPLQMLIAGGGAGLLAVDGRVRQPGLAAPRPRGVRPGEAVPAQARMGVPVLPAALAAVLASSGRRSLSQAIALAGKYAPDMPAERAAILDLIARHGAPALVRDAVSIEIFAAAGRVAGGALSREDLDSVRPAVLSCSERAMSRGVLIVPWRDTADTTNTHVVAAIDGSGLAAVACYEAPMEGLAIPALGLVAPLFAAPVMRGETRVRPGDARPSAAPIALRLQFGLVELALGVAQRADADDVLGDLLRVWTDDGAPVGFLSASRGAVGVTRTGEKALALASA